MITSQPDTVSALPFVCTCNAIICVAIVPVWVSVHNHIVAAVCIVVIVPVCNGNNYTIKEQEGGQSESRRFSHHNNNNNRNITRREEKFNALCLFTTASPYCSLFTQHL